ncbi:MAG: SDR family oxidoreductase [Candidatus Diapherotrites archaeon]
MPREKVFITGASGLLGAACCLELRNRFDVTGSYHSHGVGMDGVETVMLDFGNSADVIKKIKSAKPQWVIHTAAMTNVDLCETERARAYEANVTGAKNIALAAKECGAMLIHMSTDYVFDGKKGNYSETDALGPVSYYCETKVLGEQEVANAYPDAAIVRATIFGWNIVGGQFNIGSRIVSELRAGRKPALFTDQCNSTILVNDLAELFSEMHAKRLSGVYHAGTQGKTSKYALGLEICRAFGFDKSMLREARLSEFEKRGVLKAKRPRDTSLSSKKLEKALGRKMPEIRGCVERFKNLGGNNYLGNFALK